MGGCESGVKGYESLTYGWWATHISKLYRDRKWGALLFALTMLQEVGALYRVTEVSRSAVFLAEEAKTEEEERNDPTMRAKVLPRRTASAVMRAAKVKS